MKMNRLQVDRRTVLRGLGATMALPWLEAMSHGASAMGADSFNSLDKSEKDRLDKPPVRTAFLFFPNGVRPPHWTPKGKGDKYELTPMLSPLREIQDDVLLLENLWNEQTDGRNGHWAKVPAFLSGGYVVRTAGRDMDSGGTSIDQVMADKIGGQTPLPSLELGFDEAYQGVDNIGGGFTRIYGSHIAWRDPHTPVPKEIIPRLAFDRLFRSKRPPVVSGFTTRQKAVTDSLAGDDTSVLDLVAGDAKSLQRKLGQTDRNKIDEYLESVRNVERRIENSLKPQKRWINEGRFDVPRPGPGIPNSHLEHVRLMLDILVLAFWTDTTRISTLMFGNAQAGRDFGFLEGVGNEGYHGISHHRNEADRLDQYEKIGTWHVEQFAYLVKRMKSLSEGTGSLLDHSQILFGTSLRDGNAHSIEDLPLLMAGKACGKIVPGRRLTLEKKTPLCNLYLKMAANAGVELDRFGDSTGKVDQLG